MVSVVQTAGSHTTIVSMGIWYMVEYLVKASILSGGGPVESLCLFFWSSFSIIGEMTYFGSGASA